jgi:hypothetical protein
MDAQELIREYNVLYKPKYLQHKKESWLDTLGKIDLTIPILGVICLLLLLRRKK